jgi:hypothetical protein
VSTAIGVTNLVLGFVYLQYGTMTAVEMKRGWRTMGFSHFGAAWIAMAFTCGPHHMIHGTHVLFEGRTGGPLDLVTVLIGFPAGVTWFLLRVEAFRGGRGDRFIPGTPGWVLAIPILGAAYIATLISIIAQSGTMDLARAPGIGPNVVLIGLYGMVGYYVARTQLVNRRPLGGWSYSGLALAVIFPTCALMHGVFAFYSLSGQYAFDTHGFVIDWLSVPAALYFLGVVRSLYRDAFLDWNRTVQPAQAAPAEAL